MKTKKQKDKSYRKTKDKLDKVFSEFIRRRDKGKCFTCGAKKEWKDTDAGHYIKRQHLATRWSEVNVNCQCMGCNRFRDGNKEVYAIRLERKYGYGILQKLEVLRDKGKRFKLSELEELIEKYQNKLKELQ